MRALRAHRLPAILAMWLLLLGTATPALERLSCSMGCPTVLGIGEVEDCCPGGHDEHGSTLMAGDCCDVERAAPEHHAFTHENHVLITVPPVQVNMHLAVSATDPTAISVVRGLGSRPPPLLTLERLSRVSTFLI